MPLTDRFVYNHSDMILDNNFEVNNDNTDLDDNDHQKKRLKRLVDKYYDTKK